MADPREAGAAKSGPPLTGEPRETSPRPGRPSPRDDFYAHVNYTWLQETSIPATESRWNAFNIVRHSTTQRLRDICEATQGNGQRRKEPLKKGSNAQLVRDFYASGMDMDARNKAGLTPLQEYLTDIEQITDRTDVMGQIGRLHLINVVPFFDFMFAEDRKKAGSNAFYVWQGGLGLPERDYYLSPKEGMEEIRGQYKQHIANMFKLAGRSEEAATQAAEGVFAIELAIAQAKLPREETRIADKNYHKFTLAQAASEFPDVLNFGTYFAELGVPEIEDFIVGQPDVIRKIGEILQTTPLDDIKDYLTFTLLRTTAPTLNEEFVAESFRFNEQIVEGQTEQKPLWEQVTETMNGSILNQALGPLYCEKYFDNSDKARVMEIVGNIATAFGERIQALDWMTEETKAKALEKLANVSYKMGYPNTWIDVSGVDIHNGKGASYAQNYLRAVEFEIRRSIRQLREPFDRNEWRMQPTEVNAGADLKRSLTFTAAILQPPFYDRTADEAYNYGAFGAIAGHELSHLFDDQGSKFDVNGNLNNWWTETDLAQFTAKKQQFIEYYGRYQFSGIQVNGTRTLGENIADVAGVAVAYDAFQKYLQKHPSANIVIDGANPQERFFTGFARMWESKMTPEKALELSTRDAHSPDAIRVNAALSLLDPFYETYGVQEGDGMYIPPAERPRIW